VLGERPVGLEPLAHLEHAVAGHHDHRRAIRDHARHQAEMREIKREAESSGELQRG
jgi:hypothetical protein